MNNAVPAKVVDSPNNAGMDTMNQLLARTKLLIPPFRDIVIKNKMNDYTFDFLPR